MKRFVLVCLLALLGSPAMAAPPSTFTQAKEVARNRVYADRNTSGDLYCGCNWAWAGKSGGIVDQASCGYQVRAQANRAARIEWEHIMPASTFGRQRQCWQNGGRDNCNATDPVFNVIEADMHNLSPVVGEVNGDRSNFNIGMAAVPVGQYGQCPFKVDFQNRTAEPPNSAKGMMARVHFYMADRYGLSLSQQQARILMSWAAAYPPSPWELERDRRIAAVMGHSNEFVTGRKVWTQGYRPTRVGLQLPVAALPAPSAPSVPSAPVYTPSTAPVTQAPAAPVIGNKNSGIYHVRGLCPGYEATSEKNRVPFDSEAAALAAGFRRAGNCK